jgi:hypothetical protein
MRLKSSHAAKLEDDAELADPPHYKEQVHPTLIQKRQRRSWEYQNLPCFLFPLGCLVRFQRTSIEENSGR